MSGFALGTSNGATLGTSDGATLGGIERAQGSGFLLGTEAGATLGTESGSTLGGTIQQTALVLVAPTQSLVFSHPTADATGEGVASVTAPTNPLTLTHLTPTLESVNRFTAPVQRLELPQPTADVSGSGSVGFDAPTQPLTLSFPGAKVGFPNWVIDQGQTGTPTGETATHQSISVSFRVSSTDLLDTLRALKSDEGKVDVLKLDDGGFTAIDRAGGENSYDVIPPIQRQPLREQGVYHVERYEENLVSQSVGEWQVDLELVPDANRTDTPSVAQTADADEWSFETRYGTIATPRVDAELLGTGSDGVERFEVTARLTFEQAHVFESALSLLSGVRVKEVPDGDNVVLDETGGDSTVAVTSPGGAEVPDGNYAILSFESERLNDAYQSISFEMASI